MGLVNLSTSSELRVYDNILEAIGNTPLVRLNRIGRSLPARYTPISNSSIPAVRSKIASA
ncbi:hypothetical protein ACFLY4_02385 [Chloroflexota bacterium]